jgi:hypothetical protein
VASTQLGSAAATLDPKRVHYIDAAGQNLLFRGNMPLTANHTFAYTDLIAYMTAAAKAEGGPPFPSGPFYLQVRDEGRVAVAVIRPPRSIAYSYYLLLHTQLLDCDVSVLTAYARCDAH